MSAGTNTGHRAKFRDHLVHDAPMDPIYIAIAIPFFFTLIGVEVWVAHRRRQTLYRFADSIADLGCGVSQQVTQIFLRGALLAGYVLVYEHLRLATLPGDRWWTWVAAILGVDFAYYWFHRVSHRSNFIWATHVVHHQSEEYNLAVALRQSILQGLFSAPFYLPLALLGVPPLVFVAAATLDTLYQFWIHTRAIGRMGPLEWVLNTPSHHRVHHGINPKYIDRNYAGIFIVWDRLFGTFQQEEEEPAYGTVKPLSSWNPLWANVAEWAHIARMSRATRRWRDKLAVWVMPPEWRPEDLGGPVTIPPVSRASQRRYDTPVPRGVRRYVLAGFAMVAAATTLLIARSDVLGWGGVALLATWVLAALAGFGGLFEGRRWALPLELARHALLVPTVGWLAWSTVWLAPAVGGAAATSLVLSAWVVRLAARPREVPALDPASGAPPAKATVAGGSPARGT
ncbi:MAG: sterol desaturase family protein [Myxococcota bacterium]